MANTAHPRLVMLGPVPGTPGAAASAVQTLGTHGLLKRWPIEYLATHGEGGARSNTALALGALGRLALLLFQERHIALHIHAAADRGFWREALYMLLAIAARCPFIVHLHGAGLERFHEGAGPLRRHAIRFILEHAACVVVPCESMRASIRGLARRASVACVHHPVTPVETPPEARRDNLVLFLGNLAAARGVFDLLEAVSALRPSLPDLRLLLAGDGERLAVARYAKRLGIADAVKCTGWVGPSGKRALLESAAVLALPSYDEGLPVSLLEAMAAGVPVVASAVGGIPEIVVDGVSGFLCAPGDVANLQRLMRKLLLDRGLSARIGAAARESVRLRCAPERALARLEQLYAQLGLLAFDEAPAHKPVV
jgi:glycosyltransferase involved in cell wall biosynthesis